MSELTKLTISEAQTGLKNKEFTAVELTEAYINKMNQNRKINAYVTETTEKALQQATASQEKINQGIAGELEGVPMGIKDLFCTQGIKTTACSKILADFVPHYESTVTQKLWNAGANCLGKLNMDEFAMGGSNENSAFGPVINPWSKETPLVAGGSSGGSAAAVAAEMCLAATGTDTGGSVRQPSAYCGVTGIKPTYGRCSRYGVIAFASSLDQPGVVAKNVKDCAIVLKNMSGYDPQDATSAQVPVPDFVKVLGEDIRGLRIGIPKECRASGLDEEVVGVWDKTAEILKARGAEIVEVSLPNTKYSLPTYYIIALAEASSNLARYDGLRFGKRIDGQHLDDMYINSRTEGFGHEVKKRIMLGTYILSSGSYDKYYDKAQRVRRLIYNDFMKAYEKCDLLLVPTAPSAAFAIGDRSMRDNPLMMWLNDVYTVPVSLAGMPAISLPVGLTKSGLPLGMQLVGKPFDEETIFKAAYGIEEDVNFKGVK